ncbi:unnamed protein product [Hermetia illucens]|uniref:Uncharacterized protein n=2 Tax=Hermetia illucens TaxID=343691 RepID=A0A7R8UFK9_HERIL|nr:unnamed protein product [Hermetia illucens]
MRPYAPSAEFQLDELIPLATSLGIFGRYAKDFRTTNMIAWWKPLKFGNWKLVEAAIEKISANSVYDIYAGTAGRVVYPNNDNCMSTEELTYKVDDYQRNVPLYVWNYVSERDNEDPGVVIIGVNSPFFEAEKGIGDICKDICDGIEWFKAVNRFRKMAAMGYIFCCRPEEVRETLANFPQF